MVSSSFIIYCGIILNKRDHNVAPIINDPLLIITAFTMFTTFTTFTTFTIMHIVPIVPFILIVHIVHIVTIVRATSIWIVISIAIFPPMALLYEIMIKINGLFLIYSLFNQQ